MDPDQCLRELLFIAADIVRGADLDEITKDPDHYADRGAQLAEHVQNLDQWITKGGFMPRRWSQDGKR